MFHSVNRIASVIVVLLSFSFVLFALPELHVAKAEAQAIVVPDDYSTISWAIGNASEGDTIFVRKGTYEEHSLVINKTLTLLGQEANSTIIKNIDKLHWDLVNHFPPRSITINIFSNRTEISNLTISADSADSIGISGRSDGAKITGNIITTGYYGIQLEGSNQTIAENKILNGRIQVIGSYNVIMNNSISGRMVLGRIPESSPDKTGRGDNFFNVVYGNVISSSNGICLSGSESIVAKNDVGYISIGSGSHNVVYANRVTNGTGLHIGWGINNTIYANYVANNNPAAFLVGGTRSIIENRINGTWITNNTIHHNNFMYNRRQIWTGLPEYGYDYMYEVVTGYSGYPTNYYDDGKEGNYWSNYNGSDTNGDGIGDSPYVIDFSGNKDHYPLMAPITIFDAGTWEWTNYNVDVISNSTVSGFSFNPENALVRFNVKGETGTTGFCRVTIPKDLLNTEDDWIVLVDDNSITPTVKQDTNNTYLYFTYQHSTKTIEIIGTIAISEFPSWTILSLFLIVTLVVAIYRRKLYKTSNSSFILGFY